MKTVVSPTRIIKTSMKLISLLLLISLKSSVTGLLSAKLSMSVSPPPMSMNPTPLNSEFKRTVSMMAAAIPLAIAVTNPRIASAKPEVEDVVKIMPGTNLPLGTDGYTELGGLSMCKILNGMWQVSGGHGYEPQKEKAVSEMAHCAGTITDNFEI